MKYVLLAVIGIASGMFVAGGLFVFITMTGVLQRLATGSKTAKYVYGYESVVIMGCTIANVIFIYNIKIPFSIVFLVLYGFFSGIYTGCLSFVIAEVLNVFPILIKRLQLKKGLAMIITVFAIGKLFGALYQMLFNN